MITTKPSDYGLPTRFDPWRVDQERAMWNMLHSTTRFTIVCAPTGFGKSLPMVCAGRVSGMRILILTSTKSQQDQYVNSFGDCGLFDVRGMANYPCVIEADAPDMLQQGRRGPVMCSDGPCMDGYQCDLRELGCHYYDAMRQAAKSQMVLTNYACWLADRRRTQPLLGTFDMTIMDEAHDAPDQLAKFLTIEFSMADIMGTLGAQWLPEDAPIARWREWGQNYWEWCQDELENAPAQYAQSAQDKRRYRLIRNLATRLEALSMLKGDWVCEQTPERVRFEPVTPAEYGWWLYGDCPRVVLVGATVREKTARLIGAEPSEITVQEYSSSFPVQNRPIYHIPCIQNNFRTGDEELRKLYRTMDNFIRPRLDHRNGLIHTVSYKRAGQIFDVSQFRSSMRTHNSRDTAEVLYSFKENGRIRMKQGRQGLILVSPSMSTGVDLPDDECRYILIPKLPYPDTRSKIMQARLKADPELGPYMVSQELQQMTGRGNRHAADWCECAIFDDNFKWFIANNYGLFSRWWTEALVRCKRDVLPEPLQPHCQVVKRG